MTVLRITQKSECVLDSKFKSIAAAATKVL